MKNPNLILSQFFLLTISLFLVNCKSLDRFRNSEQNINYLKNKIESQVKYLNDGNMEGLKSVYAADYEGLSPITKFSSKQKLIDILVENQRKQQLKIEYEIIEISTSATMAYALLDWKVFKKEDTSEAQLLYHKKHFQIWELVNKNWQLKRSLFYN
jgi:hypothetical protein